MEDIALTRIGQEPAKSGTSLPESRCRKAAAKRPFDDYFIERRP